MESRVDTLQRALILTIVPLNLDPTPGHVLFFWVTSPALNIVFWWHYCPNWHNYKTVGNLWHFIFSSVKEFDVAKNKTLRSKIIWLLSEIFSNQKTTKYFRSCCFCNKGKDYIKDLPPVSDLCKLIALFIVNASCYYLTSICYTGVSHFQINCQKMRFYISTPSRSQTLKILLK